MDRYLAFNKSIHNISIAFLHEQKECEEMIIFSDEPMPDMTVQQMEQIIILTASLKKMIMF